MGGLTGHAEFGDGTDGSNEAGIGGAAAGLERRIQTGDRRDGVDDRGGEPAGRAQERLARTLGLKDEARIDRGKPVLQTSVNVAAGMPVVEPNVEAGDGARGNYVRHGVAYIDTGDRDPRWLEMLGAVVHPCAVDGCQHADQARDRVVGPLWIRGVPLNAVDAQPTVEAAAPTYFDNLAERRRAGRLADQAGIQPFASIGQPFKHLDGAVDGRPLLVPGDQQADRPIQRPRLQVAADGGDEAGDRCLHVAGASPNQAAVADLGSEGVDGPIGDVARRNHVGVAGEAEVRRRLADSGVQIVYGRRPGRREAQTVTIESQAL